LGGWSCGGKGSPEGVLGENRRAALGELRIREDRWGGRGVNCCGTIWRVPKNSLGPAALRRSLGRAKVWLERSRSLMSEIAPQGLTGEEEIKFSYGRTLRKFVTGTDRQNY